MSNRRFLRIAICCEIAGISIPTHSTIVYIENVIGALALTIFAY